MPRVSNEFTLPLPDLGELARPKRARDGAEHRKYHWRLGGELPTLGAHSVAKHNIYERYLERYIDTMARSHLRTVLNLTIVDGFCGGGLYSLGGGETDGSPLRMLAAVETAQAKLDAVRERGFRISCDFVFIDADRHHLAFLEQLLRDRGYGDRIGRDIRLINKTFEDAASNVIDGIKRKGPAHRSLFFVDQYGWSDVKLATVRRIMAELANPEVILTFMVDALINLLNEDSSLRALAAIELKRGDVQEMIRERGTPGWKRVIQNSVYRHIQSHTGARFYSPFYIHPPESHRDYWLLHLSKHHQAREEMGLVYWDEHNTMEHLGGPGLHALGFDPRVDVRENSFDYLFDEDARSLSERALLEQIPRLLRKLTADGRPITRRDLFVERANDTPVVSSHLDKQLAILRDSGWLSIQGERKTSEGILLPTDRRGASRFGWADRLIPAEQPTMFIMPRLKAKPPSEQTD